MFGPVAVISAAYVIAFPRTSTADSEVRFSSEEIRSSALQHPSADDLGLLCAQASKNLKQLLPQDFHFVVRPPFVLAGDISVARLQALHDGIIAPVSRALQATYFVRRPNQPIRIVICATEARFRQLAREWDGHRDGGYHGYYQRDKRRVLLDLAAGNGSLAHELTHALSQSDCEDLPEWFDEGLAALHEDATFSAGEKGLIGLPNWRCRITLQALKSRELPSLHDLTKPAEFRAGNVELRYAAARSVCLFLQERRLLAAYYKGLRGRDRSDVSGLETLCRILQVADVAAVERQFHGWVKQTVKPAG
ncbi:MAG: hypothetical protein JWM11_2300 [Planctomycetaceae bacterium]|nr:hypothetical protein [Planctomycetaceae bacterium]